MRVDLHTHSDRSDGTDSPGELMHKAAAAGLDVIALTDHDAATGWDEAADAALDAGVRLVRGIEISTCFDGTSVHLLGYGLDPEEPVLRAELSAVLRGRFERLPRMVEALQSMGIDITVADVEERSDNAAATGRPHVADVLVDKGVVATRDEAFERYLMPGRPAHFQRYAVELFYAVELVVNAGGVAVLAHPWARGSRHVLTPDVIGRLASAGLTGVEVDHNGHDDAARDRLRAIARAHDLVVTGSSDYHGQGKVGFDLGCNTTEPREYEKLFAR